MNALQIGRFAVFIKLNIYRFYYVYLLKRWVSLLNPTYIYYYLSKMMPLKLTDWDDDLPIDKDEEYQAFIRTLQFTEGFELLFVRCSPAGGKLLITKVKEDINNKNIEVLQLDKSINNLYEIINNLANKDQINILFITGLEFSLYEYEECKKLAGWSSKETYSYSWEGVPPVLINLNQQRERFRDNLKMCFVFLLPQFAIKYFIQRAPDFFDWRSGLFNFPLDSTTLEQESSRIIEKGDYEQYINLTEVERNIKILEIHELIEHDISSDKKANLLLELGNLQRAGKSYQEAISSYDKALEFKPDYHLAWHKRGWSLHKLGRYEEAISSYDKALEFKPNDHEALNSRGISLKNLGRYEEAISSYDKALEFKPYYHHAWNNRGISLDDLGRYEEAISSYDKALECRPDYHEAWYNKACYYALQGNIEQAIENLQTAINLNPDNYREMAKTDSDFDAIREDKRFQALIK